MGETIGVVSHAFRHGEIEGWERLVYIAASPGGWLLHNLRRRGAPLVVPASLRPGGALGGLVRLRKISPADGAPTLPTPPLQWTGAPVAVLPPAPAAERQYR